MSFALVAVKTGNNSRAEGVLALYISEHSAICNIDRNCNMQKVSKTQNPQMTWNCSEISLRGYEGIKNTIFFNNNILSLLDETTDLSVTNA